MEHPTDKPESIYNVVFYLYRDKTRFRVRKSKVKLSAIRKEAFLYRLKDELAGYTIHDPETSKLKGEWWDRYARKNYSQAKEDKSTDIDYTGKEALFLDILDYMAEAWDRKNKGGKAN